MKSASILHQPQVPSHSENSNLFLYHCHKAHSFFRCDFLGVYVFLYRNSCIAFFPTFSGCDIVGVFCTQTAAFVKCELSQEAKVLEDKIMKKSIFCRERCLYVCVCICVGGYVYDGIRMIENK